MTYANSADDRLDQMGFGVSHVGLKAAVLQLVDQNGFTSHPGDCRDTFKLLAPSVGIVMTHASDLSAVVITRRLLIAMAEPRVTSAPPAMPPTNARVD